MVPKASRFLWLGAGVLAIAGCGSSSSDTSSDTTGAGTGGTPGAGGTSTGAGGSAAGHAGTGTGGSTAGSSGAAGKGTGGTTGGSAGTGTGGSAGTAGIGGAGGTTTCGNGKKDGTEDCDGTDVGTATCTSATTKPSTGTLKCDAMCKLVTTGCTPVLPGSSKGSPIAFSPDDSIAVVCNRDVGSVTVLKVDYSMPTPSPSLVAEVKTGDGSEPWQAVVGPGGDDAYVILRHDQKVVHIKGLKTTPTLDATSATVGSEPTGIAMTPTGARLWVANWVDGTLNGIDPATMTVASTIDLNAELVKTGHLGTTVKARPALSHPRSIAISNNGDDSDADESLLVTEYYAVRGGPEVTGDATADGTKQGLVYKMALADKSITAIDLAPIADMGFQDQNSGTAGCFPNQLQSIAIVGTQAYVTSVCASPKGPVGVFTGKVVKCMSPGDCFGGDGVVPTCDNGVCSTNCDIDDACGSNGGSCDLTTHTCKGNPANIKTTTTTAVHIVDIAMGKQIGATALNKAFDDAYTKLAQADDGTRRYPLVGADIAFVPGTNIGYVAANGADSVFRLKYAADGTVAETGSAINAFIDLAPTGITPATAAGRNPIGIAITNVDHGGKKFAAVANDVSRNIVFIDFDLQTVAGGATAPVSLSTTAAPMMGTPEAHALVGKRFFNTGLGRWSLKGQGWGACQSCHVDGLTDNVTWYFARGPRQSTSLDGTFSKKDPTDQRILNWTGINDEVADFELNTRGISGGVGAIVSVVGMPVSVADRIDIAKLGHAALNGSAEEAADPANPAMLPNACVLDNWADIKTYVQKIRSPRAASNLDQAKVADGKTLFEGANCQGCHAGDKWTISKRFYEPTVATTAELKTTAWKAPAMYPATLLPSATAANQVDRAGDANNDQILCIMRNVGTYEISEADVNLTELRADMSTPGQGNTKDAKGFNPPSLLGVNVGAPYYHAGNARTLEAAFDGAVFTGHHTALAANFLADDTDGSKRDALIAFLLSIDGDTATEAAPSPATNAGGDFCVAPM